MHGPELPEPSRSEAENRLNRFAASAGERYSSDRNFDFGPTRRSNVSTLSPYIRHRLILEEEVLRQILAVHSRHSAGKFVAEVFWRAYFKGHLEHKPGIWTDYRRNVARLIGDLGNDADLLARYEQATGGKTGIACFDAWALELTETGYLHNHARMWFASIWVFTLRLPWQLGADFFYRHLLDGDPASNTLAWRWVCGLHTRGKTYLARVSNIFNYTDRRFAPQGQLAVSAPPMSEDIEHDDVPLPIASRLDAGERFGLLITEEDCAPESLPLPGAPAAIIAAVATDDRSPLPVGMAVRSFALGAVNDALVRASRTFDLSVEQLNDDDWSGRLLSWARDNHFSVIATAYAPVGPVADRIHLATRRLADEGIELRQLRRTYDDLTWPHARRGYFKLKSRVGQILEKLEIPYIAEEETQETA